MRREIPRTLLSLSATYQRNIARDEYEILLVDNGSDSPWTLTDFDGIDADIRIINVPGATHSPAPAVNLGLRHARAPLAGVLVDGARMVTPGLLDACRRASLLYPRPVISTIGFHLGREHQSLSVPKGYTREVEDRLLDSIGWPRDGYRLFEVSVLNYACAGGWFNPMSECNALFMPATMWSELGGFDEAFQCPGGGLVNLDTYERALALPGAQSVVVLGEGNFHQVHGGVSSNSSTDRWPEFHEEYKRVRHRDYRVPAVSSSFFGIMPEVARRHFPKGPHPAADYIELLKRVLLNETNLELEVAFLQARDAALGRPPSDASELLERLRQYRHEGRLLDSDLSNMPQGYTMIGRKRMDNLQFSLEAVLCENIPGDFVECGVWKGGACIFLRGMLKAHDVRDRLVWVADSFCGLPAPAPESDEGLDLSRDRYPQLAVSLERVQSYFELFGLLDDQVRFLPGWFADTLPGASIDRISLLRLDGDLYSSTMDILRTLYDKVSAGGFVIVDDYGAVPQCARAVQEFRSSRGIATPLQPIDITGVYWRKDH